MSKKTRNRFSPRRRSPYFGSISSTQPGVGSVRPARHSPHDVLPLAEGVLRDAAAARAPLPPPQRRQGPADRPAGTKAATQARSPLRTHGGTYELTKNSGNSERSLGSPVHPRCGRPVRPALGWPHEPADLALGRLAGDCHEQVQPLERKAGNSQPAQHLPPPRFLARGLGEGVSNSERGYHVFSDVGTKLEFVGFNEAVHVRVATDIFSRIGLTRCLSDPYIPSADVATSSLEIRVAIR